MQHIDYSLFAAQVEELETERHELLTAEAALRRGIQGDLLQQQV